MPKFKVGDIVRYKNEPAASDHNVNGIRGQINHISDPDIDSLAAYNFKTTEKGGQLGLIYIEDADEVGGEYELELVPEGDS